jgi:hypothetical protein
MKQADEPSSKVYFVAYIDQKSKPQHSMPDRKGKKTKLESYFDFVVEAGFVLLAVDEMLLHGSQHSMKLL